MWIAEVVDGGEVEGIAVERAEVGMRVDATVGIGVDSISTGTGADKGMEGGKGGRSVVGVKGSEVEIWLDPELNAGGVMWIAEGTDSIRSEVF